MTFADLIRQRRTDAGLSFDALAALALTSPAYLHRLETGEAFKPGRNFVIRLGIALRLDIDGVDELLAVCGYLRLTPNSQF